MTGVVVFGSANADLVLRVDRLPAPGETVLARSRARSPGGKGANQAVAAARAGGAPTTLLGALGTDDDGELLRSALTAAGVRVDLVRTRVGASGLAIVLVDAQGQNSIVVASGANASVDGVDDRERAVIADAGVLLAQLELPAAAVTEAAAVAGAAGVPVVLNAAPAAPLPEELWSHVDVLVVNESEARTLAATSDLDRAVAALLDRVPTVVTTLGGEGVLLAERGRAPITVPAYRVDAVDTTGAGDTFCGVLAAALADGRELAKAARRGSAAAAICVQRPGAIPAIPSAAEVNRMLEERTG